MLPRAAGTFVVFAVLPHTSPCFRAMEPRGSGQHRCLLCAAAHGAALRCHARQPFSAYGRILPHLISISPHRPCRIASPLAASHHLHVTASSPCRLASSPCHLASSPCIISMSPRITSTLPRTILTHRLPVDTPGLG